MAPALTETVLVMFPSVIVMTPATALVRLIVPVVVYVLVAGKQAPGFTAVRLRPMLHEDGAV